MCRIVACFGVVFRYATLHCTALHRIRNLLVGVNADAVRFLLCSDESMSGLSPAASNPYASLTYSAPPPPPAPDAPDAPDAPTQGTNLFTLLGGNLDDLYAPEEPSANPYATTAPTLAARASLSTARPLAPRKASASPSKRRGSLSYGEKVRALPWEKQSS